MTAQQERKQHIRAFMAAHYTDSRLAELLAHAQDGKLAYNSCCCFIGIATTDHALKLNVYLDEGYSSVAADHYQKARRLDGARAAEDAFGNLGPVTVNDLQDDNIRRRILIPMIRAEMRRRVLAAQSEILELNLSVAEPLVPVFETSDEVVA